LDEKSLRLQRKYANIIYRTVTDKVICVRTKGGRVLRVSPNHLFFTISNGTIVKVAAQNLKKGQFIACPLKLPTESAVMISKTNLLLDRAYRNQAYKELMEWLKQHQDKKGKTAFLRSLSEKYDIPFNTLRNWAMDIQKPLPNPKYPTKISPELAELLGWFISEGCVHTRGHFSFFNTNQEFRMRFKVLLKKIFGIEGRETQNSIRFSSVAFDEFLNSIGYVRKKAPEKDIPKCIMASDERCIKSFLEAYLRGDGHIRPRDGLSYIASSSKVIRIKLAYLLAKIGRIPRLYREKVRISKGRLDVIPGIGRLIWELMKEVGKSKHDPWFALVRRDRGTRRRLIEICDEMRIAGIKTRALETLNKLVSANIFWDQVKDIQIEEGEYVLYDLCNVGNWVGGNLPTYIHNSQAPNRVIFKLVDPADLAWLRKGF